MNARVMRAGIAGGIAGGMVMAVFSMFALRLAGSGFWTPLNLIAHTFWRAAPLDGRFSAAALVIGLAVHTIMAMLVGTLIAAAAYRVPAARSLVIAGGMLFAALLWAVMQYGIWRAVDAAAAQAFTGWVFAVAHLLFGMMAASFAALGITDADAAYQPAHRRPAGPAGRLPGRPRGRPANVTAGQLGGARYGPGTSHTFVTPGLRPPGRPDHLRRGDPVIGFGVRQLVGGGFTIPGLARLRAGIRGQSALSVLALGTVSGLAGFCAGRILGAVLTVAAASGQPLRGAVLLAIYAAGMTVPLLALAAGWDRLGIGQRRWLGGNGVCVGPLHLHTTGATATRRVPVSGAGQQACGCACRW